MVPVTPMVLFRTAAPLITVAAASEMMPPTTGTAPMAACVTCTLMASAEVAAAPANVKYPV